MARPIRFERVYDGPVEDLWELWTTKEGFEEWFAPEGCRVEVPNLELRVGGAFDHMMIPVGAEQIAQVKSSGRDPRSVARGRIVELVPNERLHIRYTVDFLPGAEPYPYDMVVEFHVEGDRVRMVVSADAHPDPDHTQLAKQVLEGQLRKFESLLAARRR
jgi:uncharacterized protein YndB with AHSA1/START domain